MSGYRPDRETWQARGDEAEVRGKEEVRRHPPKVPPDVPVRDVKGAVPWAWREDNLELSRLDREHFGEAYISEYTIVCGSPGSESCHMKIAVDGQTGIPHARMLGWRLTVEYGWICPSCSEHLSR